MIFIFLKLYGVCALCAFSDSATMTDAEQQVDEQEVLLSIYDGDPAFKQLSPTVYQYKVCIVHCQSNSLS